MVVRLSLPGGSPPLSAECELWRSSSLHRALLASSRGRSHGEGQSQHLAYATVLEPAPHVRHVHMHFCVWRQRSYKRFSALPCSSERVAPQKAGKTPLDMDQFRMMFCTCKVPGVKKDTIHNYFKTGDKKGFFSCIFLHLSPFIFSSLCNMRIVLRLRA